MGRMWQTLILYTWENIFGWLPVETSIIEKQNEYYKVLGECDKSADSGKFIEFLLKIIYNSLIKLEEPEQVIELIKSCYIQMWVCGKVAS